MKFEGSVETRGSEGIADISDEKTLIRLAQKEIFQVVVSNYREYQFRLLEKRKKISSVTVG